jgi:hypothetical protein
MKTYMGSVHYYGTGEGHALWVFVKKSPSEENFREEMMLAFPGDSYYLRAIEINDPKMLKKFDAEYRLIDESGAGSFKYYLYFN